MLFAFFMPPMKLTAYLPLLLLMISSCSSQVSNQTASQEFEQKEIYRSDELIIRQVSPSCYQHISYLSTQDYGKVECNGMVVAKEGLAYVFDTPATLEGSSELVSWLKDSLQVSTRLIVPTHFHSDCLAGLGVFHENGIPSMAEGETYQLAREDSVEVLPLSSFGGGMDFTIGQDTIKVYDPGPGHTADNMVAYHSTDRVLFGGCLVKSDGAGKGYLGDADVANWPNSIKNIQSKFPDIERVIPGHGEVGSVDLLDYTIQLFQNE